jgi:hypothetical protein
MASRVTLPGHYVTDGARLFRLVDPPERPPHVGFIELEDARSLEHVVLRATDVRRMRSVEAQRPER